MTYSETIARYNVGDIVTIMEWGIRWYGRVTFVSAGQIKVKWDDSTPPKPNREMEFSEIQAIKL